MNENGVLRIRGSVVLPQGIPAHSAVVVVQVEDVSRADAPSKVIAEIRRTGVQMASGAEVPFTVDVPAEQIDDKHAYSVRVHIDFSGSGNVSIGDLVSTQSYPILTHGFGTEVRIDVKKVN
jgi:uncharacterized lipoprotein YbaY